MKWIRNTADNICFGNQVKQVARMRVVKTNLDFLDLLFILTLKLQRILIIYIDTFSFTHNACSDTFFFNIFEFPPFFPGAWKKGVGSVIIASKDCRWAWWLLMGRVRKGWRMTVVFVGRHNCFGLQQILDERGASRSADRLYALVNSEFLQRKCILYYFY